MEFKKNVYNWFSNYFYNNEYFFIQSAQIDLVETYN